MEMTLFETIFICVIYLSLGIVLVGILGQDMFSDLPRWIKIPLRFLAAALWMPLGVIGMAVAVIYFAKELIVK